ncbi:hypothetical protein [Rhizorhapis suberifaciens]|uniref:Uncharacterized protein n=1 Tax=Rhizorhapis suberifaciens TaxID=13656 RepID=A0A840HW67_9SPHN|nr:hypothetical protein [Rhizorhapis suberifaciens]MBB4641829.1 hypothetical protein [Rhizorhapis suberifaciens]
MFSTKMFRINSLKPFVFGVALLAFPSGAVLAETIVVKAAGPSAGSYPPGRKIADNSMIALKAGDVLTVLDGRGTRTLKGPGNFNTSAASSTAGDTRNSLAGLLGTQRIRRARTGAVRGGADAGKMPRSPNLWYVDISQSSKVCVPDPANVQLWRPDLTQALLVTARDDKNGLSATIAFEKGQFRAAWPAALPVTDGGSYHLSWGGPDKPVKISFAVLGPQSEGLESMASMLISRGCEAQLNLLVDTVALPDAQPIPEG